MPIGNPSPYEFVKGEGAEFNDGLRRIADSINETYKRSDGTANQALWADSDDTLDRLVRARVGKHGPLFIEAARTKFNGTLSLEIEELGE